MAVVKKTTKKKRVTKSIDKGQVHIQASFKNTIVTFTDMAGNTLSWASTGKFGFKGSKKRTPFASQQCVEEAGKAAKEQGLRSVEVYVKGPGNGREAAIRALSSLDFNVTMIRDVSPVAHNGCRAPKARRL
ncbi:MAG: 30S ribosomal protein S11 [Clostridia bacterium]|jgi:small subunit ribosomal protein S11|nr:30S ribosomal protein S11 [Clostridia bacterium]